MKSWRMLAVIPLLAATTGAVAQAGASASAGKPLTVESRGLGQCEIFLLNGKAGSYEALVYNTVGLNDCPSAKFDSIDAKQVAQKTGSNLAWKNPRRYWMMDRLTLALAGEPRDFDSLPFNFVAKMSMPANFTPSAGQAGFAYQPTKIKRVSDYVFLKGKPVFLLRSPDAIS